MGVTGVKIESIPQGSASIAYSSVTAAQNHSLQVDERSLATQSSRSTQNQRTIGVKQLSLHAE
jgi:hypothetical protein